MYSLVWVYGVKTLRLVGAMKNSPKEKTIIFELSFSLFGRLILQI
jgi:hypothetical protein